jgi:hypothetical protein
VSLRTRGAARYASGDATVTGMQHLYKGSRIYDSGVRLRGTTPSTLNPVSGMLNSVSGLVSNIWY